MRWICCELGARRRHRTGPPIRKSLEDERLEPVLSAPHPPSLLLGFRLTSHTHLMASDANARTLSAFLDYLRVERGSAKLTIAAYTSDLAQFAEFLENRHVVLSGARREDVREYIQELFSNALDGRSVGRKLSAIRHLYRHLLLDGKIDKDPTLNIDLPKQWKVLPKALSRDEVGAMLAATKRPKRSREMKRRAGKRLRFATMPCWNFSMREECACRKLPTRVSKT